uniref:DNA-directed RNA polymerase n=1 Tax=Panagrolaimus superbus TaxID=310955 RepID=A0A914YK52_9BILA
MADVAEVQRAYDNKEVELQTRLTVRIEEFEKGEDGEWVKTIKRYETTAGRALLSEILPKGMPFTALNRALKKKEISRLINQSFRRCGLRATVIFADKLMQSGSVWQLVVVFPSP